MRRPAVLVVTLAVVLALPGLGGAVGDVLDSGVTVPDGGDDDATGGYTEVGATTGEASTGDAAADSGSTDATSEAVSAGGEEQPTHGLAGQTVDRGATEAAVNESNGTVSVGIGSQLSTVLSTTEDEVDAAVSQSVFDSRFAAANESERARLVANRSATLRAEADRVLAEYRNATRAWRDGALNRSAYAQRLATLESQADSVRTNIEHLRNRSANVSALELEVAGFNRSALSATAGDLASVAGSEPSALLRRFTGRTDGEVRIENDTGVSVEVERESGERSREIRRSDDGNDSLSVPQGEALRTARAALTNGSAWSLREASRHPESGYYEFEFGLRTATETGEAEVRVDGSAGTVVRLEEEFERREGPGERDRNDTDGNETDPEDPEDERPGNETDSEREDLALLVVAGTPDPGATLTLEARQAGAAAPNATVRVDDERVGPTDDRGRINVTLGLEETEITAERGEGEAELEFEFERDSTAAEDLNVSAALDGETVSVDVRYDGEGVAGVRVFLDGDRVGVTGPDGTTAFGLGDRSGEVELELTKGEFEVERTYRIENGSLVPVDERDESEETETEEDDETEGEETEEDDETEGEETEEDDETETESGTLNVSVAAGDPAPNATVTVEVRRGDRPVNATVLVDDERVGETGPNGRIEVTLSGEETEVTAIAGDDEVEREFEFDDQEQDDSESEQESESNSEEESESNSEQESESDSEGTQTDSDASLDIAVVAGDPAPNATVTVEVRRGDRPVNATVLVDDERVGQTGPNGRIEVTLSGAETELTALVGDDDVEREFEFDD